MRLEAADRQLARLQVFDDLGVDGSDTATEMESFTASEAKSKRSIREGLRSVFKKRPMAPPGNSDSFYPGLDFEEIAEREGRLLPPPITGASSGSTPRRPQASSSSRAISSGRFTAACRMAS